MSSILCLSKFCNITPTSCLRKLKMPCILQRYSHALRATSSLLPCLPTLTSKRSFWESFPYVKPFLHEKDKLNKEIFEMVYRAAYFNYVFYGQLISLGGFSVQIFGASYHAFQSHVAGEIVSQSSIGSYSITYDLLTLAILGFFTFQNFLLFVAAQSAVLRVYHKKDTDEYVFVTLKKNPFKTNFLFCKPGDLVDLKMKNAAIIFGSHKLDGKRLFMREDYFKTMWHYNRLLREW